jgi:hypothetical protein
MNRVDLQVLRRKRAVRAPEGISVRAVVCQHVDDETKLEVS